MDNQTTLPTPNLRGHDHSYGKPDERRAKWLTERFAMVKYFPDRIKPIQAALRKSAKTKTPIPFPMDWIERCPDCGDAIHFEAINGGIQTRTACQFKDGTPPLEFDIPIPSGKMVFANDLRRAFRLIGDEDINRSYGQRVEMLRYAETGLAYLFAGNSCPAVRQIPAPRRGKPTEFAVGKKPDKRNWVSKGGICTDLWAVCIADAGLLDQSLASQGLKMDEDAIVLACRPGTYTIRYLGHQGPEERYNTLATITWKCAETKPIGNPYETFLNQEFTLEEVAAEYFRRGKFFPEKKTNEDRARDFLSQTFFTLGNGCDWHPKGWGSCYPMQKLPGRAPRLAPLTKAHHWYPVSEYSLVALIGGLPTRGYPDKLDRLNNSFLSGFIDCLDSILRHGVKAAKDNHKKWNEIQARSTQNLCQAVAAGLLEREHAERGPVGVGRIKIIQRLQNLVEEFGLQMSKETYLAADAFEKAVHGIDLGRGMNIGDDRVKYQAFARVITLPAKGSIQRRKIQLICQIRKYKDHGDTLDLELVRHEGELTTRPTKDGTRTTWKPKGKPTQEITPEKLAKEFSKAGKPHKKPNQEMLEKWKQALEKEAKARAKFEKSRVGRILREITKPKPDAE